MRSEEQVINQIMAFCRADDNIRAVIMNGSRVNPNTEKDIFCDYDIVCFVYDLNQYVSDQSWISYFGDLVIMQFNRHDDYPEEQYVYLMQFADGVRIDLSFASMNMIVQSIEDSLTIVLLDKDQCMPLVPAPNDSSYITKPPDQKTFEVTVNEFWWVSTYVAKGLWRQEPVYAKFMYDVIVHECLRKMVTWYAAMQYDWNINVGKVGKYLEKLLPSVIWQDFVSTYPGVGEDEIWTALFKAGDLMRQVAIPVAQNLGYTYPSQDDERVSLYLKHVKTLPKDATSFD